MYKSHNQEPYLARVSDARCCGAEMIVQALEHFDWFHPMPVHVCANCGSARCALCGSSYATRREDGVKYSTCRCLFGGLPKGTDDAVPILDPWDNTGSSMRWISATDHERLSAARDADAALHDRFVVSFGADSGRFGHIW